MSRKYISTTETAKLIRKSLKEAFPEVKFSVLSQIRWRFVDQHSLDGWPERVAGR
jgi:uncharacterized protein with HEPN domain